MNRQEAENNVSDLIKRRNLLIEQSRELSKNASDLDNEAREILKQYLTNLSSVKEVIDFYNSDSFNSIPEFKWFECSSRTSMLAKEQNIHNSKVEFYSKDLLKVILYNDNKPDDVEIDAINRFIKSNGLVDDMKVDIVVEYLGYRKHYHVLVKDLTSEFIKNIFDC